MKKIFRLLKHLLVPHDRNDYKPHLFRELGVSVLLFTSVFLLGSSAGSSFFIHKTVLGAEIASSVLIDLTNESRLAYNQHPLVRSAKLDQAAQLKGEDMASKEYFSHNSPDGVTPWHWFKMAGYNFLYAGENLAINFTDSADVEEAWLNSPTHRANIMNVEFREIGVATVRGYYKNYPTIYIVQMFGTPAYSAPKGIVSEKVNTPLIKKIASSTPPRVSTSTQDNLIVLAKGEEGSVKGVEIVASSTIEKIMDTQEMAIVKNTSVEKIPSRIELPLKKYSTWYERILFNMSYYIGFIYKALILLIAFGLVTLILVEMRKQHYKHILYAVLLLLLLSVFLYINQGFF